MFTTGSAVQCSTQSGLRLTLSRPRLSGSSSQSPCGQHVFYHLSFFLIFYPLPPQFTQSIRPAKSVYLEQSERGWATAKQEEELPDSGSCELTLIWMFVKTGWIYLYRQRNHFHCLRDALNFIHVFFFKKRKCFCFFNVYYFDVLIFALTQYSGAKCWCKSPSIMGHLWTILLLIFLEMLLICHRGAFDPNNSISFYSTFLTGKHRDICWWKSPLICFSSLHVSDLCVCAFLSFSFSIGY